MLESSLLGTLYCFWCHSAVFSLLQKVYRFFSNAWTHSLTRRMLVRESRVQRAFEASLFAHVMQSVLNGIVRLFGKLLSLFGRLNAGGVNYRLWQRFGRGSVILRYEFLFGAFIAVMFLCPHDLWSNTYALLISMAFLILYQAVCAGHGRRAFDPVKLGLPFFLSVFSTVLSLGFTHAPGDSVRVLFFFLTAFLLCYLAAGAVWDRRSLMTILGMLYAAVLLTSFYAVAQRLIGVKVSSSFTDLLTNKGVPGRVYSTLDNPNNFAEFLVLMTPLSAVWAINVKTTWKNIPLSLPLCLALAVPMLALLMTYSRNGWIAIALAAVVFVYFAEKKLIPVLFLAAVLAAPFMPDSVITRFSTIFTLKDSSNNHRIHLWRGVLLMLRDYGITGIGLGPESFELIFPTYARRLAQEGAYHTQMLYLELLVETGVFGFISFMWFYLRTVKNSVCKLVRSSSKLLRLALCACAAALAGIAFSSLVEYIWYYPRILFAFFLVCGFAIGFTNLEDSQCIEETEE